MDPPAAAAYLTLVVEKGPRKGETVECRPGGRVRIGRVVKGNTFAVKDAGISQAHLSVEAAGGGAGWVVTDLGSSNGTLLNGVQIEPSAPSALRDGDAIKIGGETVIRVTIAEVEASAPQAAAGPRRNPRRGRAVVAAEAPQGEAGGAARGKGRPSRKAAYGGDDAGDEERRDLTVKESVEEPRKKTAARRGRGRGAPKKTAMAPRCLDPVSEESKEEDLEALENKVLKEVKQEISDSVQILSVEGSKAGARRGRGAPRRAAATSGAPEEEQVRVEDERDAPSREEGDAAGANPDVEEGGVDMENMTLEEWFDRMEKYLPKVINEIAEEIISEIKAKAERFNEYVGNSLDSVQQDVGGEFIGLT